MFRFKKSVLYVGDLVDLSFKNECNAEMAKMAGRKQKMQQERS